MRLRCRVSLRTRRRYFFRATAVRARASLRRALRSFLVSWVRFACAATHAADGEAEKTGGPCGPGGPGTGVASTVRVRLVSLAAPSLSVTRSFTVTVGAAV